MSSFSSMSTLPTTSSISPNLFGQILYNKAINTADLENLTLSTGDHPVELADWTLVNEKLRHKGLMPVVLTHQNKLIANLDGYTILDSKSSDLLRKTILHLLQENDRIKKILEHGSSKEFILNSYTENKSQINQQKHDINTVTNRNPTNRDIGNQTNFDADKISKYSKRSEEGFDDANRCCCFNFLLTSDVGLCKDTCVLHSKLEKYKKKYQELKAEMKSVKEKEIKCSKAKGVTSKRSETRKYTNFNEVDKLESALSQICSTLRVSNTSDAAHAIKELQKEVQSIRCSKDDLHFLIKELAQLVTPWQNTNEVVYKTPASISDLTGMLKQLIDATHKRPQILLEINTEKHKYLVEYFMHLFNIGNIDWVYTQMHDFYAKFKRMENAFHTIRKILNMNSKAKLNNIIDGVGQLAKAKHLLHLKNIDGIINDIENYQQFYKSFHDMVNELLEILGVDYPEDIIPSIKRLISD